RRNRRGSGPARACARSRATSLGRAACRNRRRNCADPSIDHSRAGARFIRDASANESNANPRLQQSSHAAHGRPVEAYAIATWTRLSEYEPAWPKVQCLSELIEFTEVPLRLRLGQ